MLLIGIKDGKPSQTLFGKNSAHGIPVDSGKIIDETKVHTEQVKISFSQSVSKENFEKAYNTAITIRDAGGGMYHATVDNCISYSQAIYFFSGGNGHFINNFDKSALEQSGTMAANHALAHYGNNQLPRVVSGISEIHVSMIYGVPLTRIIENYDHIGGTTFTILPESNPSSINNNENSQKNSSAYNAQDSYVSEELVNAILMSWQTQEQQLREILITGNAISTDMPRDAGLGPRITDPKSPSSPPTNSPSKARENNQDEPNNTLILRQNIISKIIITMQHKNQKRLSA